MEVRGREVAYERLLQDLARSGYPLPSVTELRHSGMRYTEAVPALIYWLPEVSDPASKEEIVRALTVPWARPKAAQPLVREFTNISDDLDPTFSLRWAIGSALEVVADDSVYDDLVVIVQEPRYGIARQMVVLALGKSKRPDVVPVLIGLLDDEEVSGHSVASLAKLKSLDARPALERMLSDRRAWVRRDARKGIDRLDRLQGSGARAWPTT